MKRRLSSAIASVMVEMFFLSMMAILPAYAVKVPEIYLVPSTISPSFKWNITAWVKNIPADNATFAYQVKLFFNTSFLECRGAWIPKWDEAWIFSGMTTVSPAPTIDNLGGYGVVGDSIFIGASVSGSGPFSLAVFEFQILSELDEDPLSYISINNPYTYLLNDALEEISPIIKTEDSDNDMWSLPTTSQQTVVDVLNLNSDRLALNGSVELIVGLNDGIHDSYAKVEALAIEHGGQLVNKISTKDKVVAAVVKLSREIASSFEAKVKAAGLSTYVEPNRKFKAFMVPDDPYWQYQWGPKTIQADWAWNTTLGDPSILVAVVDSGIDYTHPDLNKSYVPLGHNWVNIEQYTNPMDDCGHGTHVAGIIAATLNNSKGIAGLAQVRIMAEKALDEYGWGFEDQLANAINHAADQEAKIISMSWGGFVNSSAIYEAIRYAYYNQSVLLVAAAGNEATSTKVYPAAYDEVIAVAATNQTDYAWEFSNHGDWIELSAPGVNIYSTMPTYHVTWNYPPANKSLNYDNMTGTSMAAPHVAGVAALIWSRFPNMTRDDVRYQLGFTADDLGDVGFDKTYGLGRINARKAVEEVKPEHDLGIIRWEAPSYTLPTKTVHVKTIVLNFGLKDEYNVKVELKVNRLKVNRTQISILPRGATAIFDLSWTTPNATTNVLIQSVVVPVAGETRITNNDASTKLAIRYPSVLQVPQEYPTIQSAIGAAMPMDIIKVSNGTYYEHLWVNKPEISIIGQNKETTIIDGSNKGTVVTILEPKVTISGFTIQNGSEYEYNVLVMSSGNNISNNVVKNGNNGIWLDGGSYSIIHGNIVTQIYDAAIALWPGSYNNISQNIIVDAGVSVAIGGEGNKIYKNRISSVPLVLPYPRYGIFALSDWYTEIFDNEVTFIRSVWKGVGILSVLSKRIRIEGNSIRGNDYGLYLNSVTGINVTGNKVVGNTRGVHLDNTRITVRGNYIKDNGVGLSIDVYGATDNKIYWNNFINNTYQVQSLQYPNRWTGHWNVTGNYWSDYNGTDSDGNTIGDTPYVIDVNNVDYWPLMAPWLPGDVYHDGKVDIKDIARVAKAYGSHGPPNPSPNWNPHADLNEDGFVNDSDLDIVVPNFGKTWRTYWGE